MKNKKNIFGLVICRNNEEKIEKFKKVIDEAISKFNCREREVICLYRWVGKKFDNKRKYVSILIKYDAFKNKDDFDTFLYKISEKLNDMDDIGLFVGHNIDGKEISSDYYNLKESEKDYMVYTKLMR